MVSLRITISLVILLNITFIPVIKAGPFTLYVTGTPSSIATFDSVKGLEGQTKIITYRESNSNSFNTIKMPGIAKYNSVTLQNVVFSNNQNYWQYLDQTRMDTESRSTYIIKHENGLNFTLKNAWVTQMPNTASKNNDGSVTIDSMEITYDTLKISDP